MEDPMYERILVPLDGSETSDDALAHAVGLASEQRAKLELLHVVDELGVNLGPTPTPDAFWVAAHKAGDRILEEGRTRASLVGIDAQTKLIELRSFGAVVRRVADVIVDEAARWPADLIVIGTHGRRGLSKLMLGSVAEGVVRTASVPVLLVRGHEGKRAPSETG
jgi:nucleotide-binding universal stress UspA family protein